MNSLENAEQLTRSNQDCANSPFVDIEFLRAVLGGCGGPPESVIAEYRRARASRLMPFHPLIDPHQFSPRVQALLKSGDLASVLEWLRTRSASGHQWSAMWDPSELGLLLVPDSQGLTPKRLAEARARAAANAFATLGPDQPLPGFSSGTSTWGELRLSIIEFVQDVFGELGSGATLSSEPVEPQLAGVTVIVCDNLDSPGRLVRSVWSMTERASSLGSSILVGVDPRRPLHGMLEIVARVHGAADCVVFSGAGGTLRESVLRASSRVLTENVVLLDSDVTLRDGALEAMVAALSDKNVAACQPVLTRPDGTIAAVGLAQLGHGEGLLPQLAGLARDDLPACDALVVPALAPGVMAMRTESMRELLARVALVGVPSLATELGIRLSVRGSLLSLMNVWAVMKGPLSDRLPLRDVKLPSPWVAPQDAWKESGWKVLYVVPPTKENRRIAPILIRPDLHPLRDATRWAIKIGAGFSRSGDRWGDVPFAEDLAEGLRRAGCDVVVDRFHPDFRRESYLDDVVLAVRGRHAIQPVLGRKNILWVISQPELVELREFDGFDIIAAASEPWAKRAAALSGRDVHVLLQAASEGRFYPADSALGDKACALFVGGARPPDGRRVVANAQEAGIPLELWGPRWDQYGFADSHAGEFLPNADLPAMYSRAGVVLSDHTPEMLRHGFISNRVFEAVASGARVISDAVDGLSDVFGDSVRTYRNVLELGQLFAERETEFPGEEERRRRAKEFMEKHSIRARVAELLALAGESPRSP